MNKPNKKIIVYVISESNLWPIYKGVNKENTIFGHKFATLVTNLPLAPNSPTFTFQRSSWHQNIHSGCYPPDQVKRVQQMKLDDGILRDIFETVNMNLFINGE